MYYLKIFPVQWGWIPRLGLRRAANPFLVVQSGALNLINSIQQVFIGGKGAESEDQSSSQLGT